MLLRFTSSLTAVELFSKAVFAFGMRWCVRCMALPRAFSPHVDANRVLPQRTTVTQTGHPVWRSPDEFRLSEVVMHKHTRDKLIPTPRPPDVAVVTTGIPERFTKIREPGHGTFGTIVWGECVWAHQDQVRVATSMIVSSVWVARILCCFRFSRRPDFMPHVL